ncbi:MAG: bifunctional [glutamate--ammonia ligase]-adenylyl-L-tyrosine phosphorylase/[glutamate--ammonia-ligase] adenylyltransferase [Candidatus Binataceae bacterium]|jgi:glutamate-ammonia-ligase adenylyltransferase
MSIEPPLPAELAGLAAQLATHLGDPQAAAAAVSLVRHHAPDERVALAFMVKLAEQSRAILNRALAEPGLAAELAFCLGASELVGAELCWLEAGWLDLFERARAHRARSILDTIRAEVPTASNREDAVAELAAFRRRHFLEIAIADLVGAISVSGTMAAMSRLADECIRAALSVATRLAGKRAELARGFCVIAMGKLGVDELNLSSDLDLMYIFESPSGSEGKSGEAAARIGTVVSDLLSASGFRLDLRLRPGGRSAPLAASLAGALSFYQSFGQTWERAALLRARPVAGAIEVGERFTAELGHFIYRRYLDFDTVRQLRAMKRQIEDELRSPELVERNIKLGRGGIRELEFIVQALMLIYGGRDVRLRRPQTVAALERLSTLGYLAPERARELLDAYLFLRDVEHKLQVVAGVQTHSLPSDERGFAALAARMRFGKSAEAPARMREKLKGYRDTVATLFRELLAESGDLRAKTPVTAAAQAAWAKAIQGESAEAELGLLGFAHPGDSLPHLTLLAQGPAYAPSSPRRRELIGNLGPLLLDELSRLADPDLALMNLAAFIAAVGARTSFLALLEQHPATRQALLRLFASSRHLSTVFIQHPEMLDTLVRSDLARPRRPAAELDQELGGLMAAKSDFENRLDALRSLRYQEFLRVAIADIAGDLKLEEVQSELTLIAETVLRHAFALAIAETTAAGRVARVPAMCVLAMGRLGGAEMTYNSDLDLIFVFDDSAGDIYSAEAAARVAQKLIAILEAPTREGYCYKLDLRLRPSGYAGPLVTSLEAFRDYHRRSSALWERQALVRARVAAGDAALGEAVEAARNEFVFGRGLSGAEVAQIAAMRARMEREIGVETRRRLNIKQGRGGLVDVEFIAQMMALRYGGKYPELRERATPKLLDALARCELISSTDYQKLRDGYRFLLQLENRLRIETDQPAWSLSPDPADLAPLARRMGFAGTDAAQRLLDELARRRGEIRDCFTRIFAAEQAR